MKNFKAAVDAFLNDESGASAVEYGLLVAVVAIGAVTAYTALAGKTSSLFTGVGTKIQANTPQ